MRTTIAHLVSFAHFYSCTCAHFHSYTCVNTFKSIHLLWNKTKNFQDTFSLKAERQLPMLQTSIVMTDQYNRMDLKVEVDKSAEI